MTAYHNPVMPGFFSDPAVCRVGNDFYAACSSMEYWPGYPILHSRDLINWRIIGHVFTDGSGLDLSAVPHGMGLWGGGLKYIRGRLYCVTTCSEGAGITLLSSATNPAGPWSLPLRMPYLGMDPDLFEDLDGTVYFLLRAYGPGRTQPVGIRMAPIDLETGRLLAELRLILPETNRLGIEGARLFHHAGWYYLHCAAGGTGLGHCQAIWRSKNLWGPYEAAPQALLANQASFWGAPQCLGHGEVLDDAQGRWWMVFHGNRLGPQGGTLCGRELFAATVTWRDAWPIANDGHLILNEREADLPPAHPWPQSNRDTFNTDALPLRLVSLRQSQSWSLSERPGFLVLHGKDGVLSDPRPSPAWIGRRLDIITGTVRTQIEFDPNSESQEAGLVVWLNEEHHAALAIILQNGKRAAVLRRQVADLCDTSAAIPLKPGPIILRLDFDAAKVSASIEQEEGIIPVGSHRRHLLSFEVGGQFSGPFVAMYATGQGKSAAFAWLEMNSKEEGK